MFLVKMMRKVNRKISLRETVIRSGVGEPTRSEQTLSTRRIWQAYFQLFIGNYSV